MVGAIALTDHSAAAAVARFLRQGPSIRARAQARFGKNDSLSPTVPAAGGHGVLPAFTASAAKEKKLVLSALFVKNKGRMC